MTLTLMYITNNEKIAKVAEDSGVDWIFVDLEIIGKEDRQGHLNAVISHHQIEDVKKIKSVLTTAKLLVRVNPIHVGSEDEINRVITDGADIVMLPMFKSRDEVAIFLNYVQGRAKTCLLCETAEAAENIDDILTVEGIDSIHIGLNDLHLAYKKKFMFELLADGTVDMLCTKFKAKGIAYGIGGIARPGKGDLPAEYIIAEHYRLGSNMAILSRTFCKANEFEDEDRVADIFHAGVKEIRALEARLNKESPAFFEHNRILVCEQVMKITGRMGGQIH